MATLIGGPSTTFGIEFQALWIAGLMLDVLRGAAVWVRVEPGDLVVRKAECVVHRPDGTDAAHQCKRQRGSAGIWSAANLEADGVISAADEYLRRSSDHHFYFVSGDPAPAIRTLCERAGQFDRLDEFRAEAASDGKTRQDLRTLATLLRVDLDVDADLARLRDFLRRFHPVVEDAGRQRGSVEEIASRWVEGPPHLVVHSLEALANTTVRRQVDANDLKVHLEGSGFRLRDLTIDQNLPLQLASLCNRYHRSFEPFLIGGRTLGRLETKDVLKAVEDPSVRVVLVEGPGGFGKSGVLYEAFADVRSRGVPCLAVRLDQDELAGTLVQQGRNLGLPASPVSSLASAAGGRPAVLFIDQLDAVRWTSQHVPRALDVIIELVWAALSHPEITVVIACRTFDVKDDVRIAALFREVEAVAGRLFRVEVAALTQAFLNGVLTRLGVDSASLTAAQRETLRSLQNVWLLAKLHAEEGPTPFVSGSDLNRQYWAWVRRQLSDQDRTTLDRDLLPLLVSRSFRAGTATVPGHLRSRHERAVGHLLSVGALVSVGQSSIRFAHQTQFDFLAAEQLSEQLDAGHERLTDWLVRHDSLFHRNQVRQLLEMLRDDDAGRFLREVAALIGDARVRFHLKHVALQVLGSADHPTQPELDFLLGLDSDPSLSPHVRQLFLGSVAWFDVLHDRGLVQCWANAVDEPMRWYACWLMRPLVGTRGDVIDEVTRSVGPDARQQVLAAVLNFADLGLLTDGLFSRFLQLIRADSPATTFADLKKLGQSSPRRVLSVFGAQSLRLLRSLASHSEAEGSRDRVEHTLFDCAEVMRSVAGTLARNTWRALWDVAERCRRLRRRWDKEGGSRYDRHRYDGRQALRRLARLAEELLVIAGTQIAREQPDRAWLLVQPHLNSGRRARQRVAIKVLAALPPEHGERVLALLARNPALLVCGASRRSGSHYRASKTFPARRLLRRFGPAVTDTILAELEACVRSQVPKWERQDFRTAHDYFMGKMSWLGPTAKHTLWPRTVFATQYALLDAFPVGRLSGGSRDWFGVLARKFGGVSSVLKEQTRKSVGSHYSTIPEERLQRLSDAEWTRLMSAGTSEDTAGKRRARPERSRPTLPGLYAPQLERAVHREPTRFARLATRLPTSTHPEYVAVILRALAKTEQPEKADAGWAPAPAAVVEPLLSRFVGCHAHRQVALDFCWLLRHRYEDHWGQSALNNLVAVARFHDDPAEVTTGTPLSLGGEPHDYSFESLNCVRSAAAGAIAAILHAQPAQLALFRPALNALKQDPHPAVRMAAAGIALPMLNIDRDAAVAYVLELLSDAASAVLAASELTRFLGYTLLRHSATLKPVLHRMLESAPEQVAERGAEFTMLMYLRCGQMRSEIDGLLLDGRPAHRRGLATVLSQELARGDCGASADDWVVALLNDSDASVRDATSRVFWQSGFYGHPSAARLLGEFARSTAFGGMLNNVLHGLAEAAVSLVPLADAVGLVVERLVAASRADPTATPFVSHELPDVLLRLYEECDADSPARSRCLDYIDAALRDKLAYDLVRQIQ